MRIFSELKKEIEILSGQWSAITLSFFDRWNVLQWVEAGQTIKSAFGPDWNNGLQNTMENLPSLRSGKWSVNPSYWAGVPERSADVQTDPYADGNSPRFLKDIIPRHCPKMKMGKK